MKNPIRLYLFGLGFFLCGGIAGISQNNTGILFVSPSGSDQNSGSISKPLKTIQVALDLVDKVGPGTSATVYLRSGTYPVDKTITITKKIGRKILISAYENEQVIISGGKQLNNKLFKLVATDMSNKISPIAAGKLYVTDLTAQNIIDFGTIKKNGFGVQKLPAPLELFAGNQPLQVARWPNLSNLSINNVIERGDKKSGKAPAFVFKSDERKKWLADTNIWVAGQFSVGWAFDNLPVKNIDLQRNIVSIKEPASYGVYTKDDNSTSIIATARNIRGFYFYNILSELDSPGEWFLDRAEKKLYVWPVESMDNTPFNASMLETPILTIDDSREITIVNISFSYTRGTGIEITGSNNILIQKCAINNTGLEAMKIAGSENIMVSYCTVFNNGAGGIVLGGGDRKKLIAANNAVKNCEFYNYSRLYRTYCPAVNINGVGNQVSNCFIHDAEGQAIIFYGNNHLIENNHIASVCKSFNDIGAVYTGRDLLTAGTVIKNNFFDNLLNPRSLMVAAVYFDDGSGGMTVSNNIFYKCGSQAGFGGVHINGGANSKFINNIFANCPRAFSTHSWSDSQWNRSFNNPQYLKKLNQNANINSEQYQSAYPFMKQYFSSNVGQGRKNYLFNTVFYAVTKLGNDSSFIISNVYNQQNFPMQNTFTMPTLPDEVKKWANWSPVDFDKIGIER